MIFPLMFLLLTFVFVQSTLADTISISVNNTGGGDSEVQETAGNIGTGESIWIGGGGFGNEMRGYYKFNLSTMPTGATITNATMYLQEINFGTSQSYLISAYEVNDSTQISNWGELTVTWANQPCGTGVTSLTS